MALSVQSKKFLERISVKKFRHGVDRRRDVKTAKLLLLNAFGCVGHAANCIANVVYVWVTGHHACGNWLLSWRYASSLALTNYSLDWAIFGNCGLINDWLMWRYMFSLAVTAAMPKLKIFPPQWRPRAGPLYSLPETSEESGESWESHPRMLRMLRMSEGS